MAKVNGKCRRRCPRLVVVRDTNTRHQATLGMIATSISFRPVGPVVRLSRINNQTPFPGSQTGDFQLLVFVDMCLAASGIPIRRTSLTSSFGLPLHSTSHLNSLHFTSLHYLLTTLHFAAICHHDLSPISTLTSHLPHRQINHGRRFHRQDGAGENISSIDVDRHAVTRTRASHRYQTVLGLESF